MVVAPLTFQVCHRSNFKSWVASCSRSVRVDLTSFLPLLSSHPHTLYLLLGSQEIQALTSNYSQLKQAQGLFKKSKLAVQAVTPASVGECFHCVDALSLSFSLLLVEVLS